MFRGRIAQANSATWPLGCAESWLGCVVRYSGGPDANGCPQEQAMGIISFIKGGVAELAIARPD